MTARISLIPGRRAVIDRAYSCVPANFFTAPMTARISSIRRRTRGHRRHRPRPQWCASTRGQATIEFALAMLAGIIPLTLGLLAFTEIAWTYHALATLTRQGARYAATHSYDGGSNVASWMQNNSPAFPGRSGLLNGEIGIEVRYWTHNPLTNVSEEFNTEGCTQCVPDSVTVSILPYEFEHFLTQLGLEPLTMPAFSTTVEMQGGGIDPETGAPSQ